MTPAIEVNIRSTDPQERDRCDIYSTPRCAHEAIRRWLLSNGHERLVWIDDLNAVSVDHLVSVSLKYIRI